MSGLSWLRQVCIFNIPSFFIIISFTAKSEYPAYGRIGVRDLSDPSWL